MAAALLGESIRRQDRRRHTEGGKQSTQATGQPGKTGQSKSGFTPKSYYFKVWSTLVVMPFGGAVLRPSNASCFLTAEWLVGRDLCIYTVYPCAWSPSLRAGPVLHLIIPNNSEMHTKAIGNLRSVTVGRHTQPPNSEQAANNNGVVFRCEVAVWAFLQKSSRSLTFEAEDRLLGIFAVHDSYLCRGQIAHMICRTTSRYRSSSGPVVGNFGWGPRVSLRGQLSGDHILAG